MRSPLLCSLFVAAGILLTTMAGTRAEDPAAARFRGTGKADPIRIENVTKVPGGATDRIGIRCDVAWDHSWRAAWTVPAEAHGGSGPLTLDSWDAAWLFVKYRMPDADGWSPATLAATAGDHAAPPAAQLDVGLADDGQKGVGVFARRAAAGSGPNEWKGVTLRWLHAADGVAEPAAAEVRVFAIHMVYVPECAYWLGDGSTSYVAAQFSAGDSAAPFRVESEAELILGGTSPKNLGNRDTIGQCFITDDFSSSVPRTLPARFPKGHAAFYCMRHELTEGQMVEYLNSLSSQAQAANPAAPEKPTGYNNAPLGGITVATPSAPGKAAVFSTKTPHVACEHVMVYEGRAYAAWAGLRPMTELEYEKACRGPLRPVADEFAWGTAAIVGDPLTLVPGYVSAHGHAQGARPGYVVAAGGAAEERATWQGEHGPDATHGNAVWAGSLLLDAKGTVAPNAATKPVRAGIFTAPESDRVASGASYWGIMELSGNLGERVVPVGNMAGRRFDGSHGAPPPSAFTIGTGAGMRKPEEWAWGMGIRGGTRHQQEEAGLLRVSDRERIEQSPKIPARLRNASRHIGFRCVRTARIVPLPPRAADDSLTALPSNNGVVTQDATKGWDDATVVVKNVAVAARDADTAIISFDVSWPTSWRTDRNHDAAWVFFKANAGAAGWRHVKLVADKIVNPTGYGQGDGGTRVDCIVPGGADGFTGLFIRRAAPGAGPVDAQRVSVVCSAGSVANLPQVGNAVRGFGIPMVYVAEGGFALGSDGPEVGAFYRYDDGVAPAKPYRVTGPGPIPTGRQPGRLWAGNHGGPLVDGGEIPATYPNGFSAFYCMRFHITPMQYAEMLNTLDPKTADDRYPGRDRCVYNIVSYTSPRNGFVDRGSDGTYAGRPGRERAGAGCFGLSWADGATFAAWAGLRPMTELEFEKAVRGPREPAANEIGPSYWGVTGFGTNEWDSFKGEPSCERPVTAGAAGLRFKATHGPGTTALPADWPQADAVGSGVRVTHYTSKNLERLRGLVEPPGFFQPVPSEAMMLSVAHGTHRGQAPAFGSTYEISRSRVADRAFAGVADAERLWSHKWRGVRTAPKGVGP